VIDLYYQHRVDPDTRLRRQWEPWRSWFRRKGSRSLRSGLATIRQATVHPISALQTEYSLWSREPEAEILPTCRELGIGFVPYSPLGEGFLPVKSRASTLYPREIIAERYPRFRRELTVESGTAADGSRQGSQTRTASPAWF